MTPTPLSTAWLAQLQREAELVLAINFLAGLVVLAFFIWLIIWSFRAFARWERRDEAKVKALQRIAARLPDPVATTADEMRATR